MIAGFMFCFTLVVGAMIFVLVASSTVVVFMASSILAISPGHWL
jgi:hypothetical protein